MSKLCKNPKITCIRGKHFHSKTKPVIADNDESEEVEEMEFADVETAEDNE